MFGLSIDFKVYVAIGATDMRKSINGLSLLVEDQFGLDLFSGNLFAFCNRRQDIVKILYWSESGFCVWMKKLEKESFRWPKSVEEALVVSQIALSWLLHGLDLNQAHRQLTYDSVG
jgi:transposase